MEGGEMDLDQSGYFLLFPSTSVAAPCCGIRVCIPKS